MSGLIDLLVGVYGWADNLDGQVGALLDSLHKSSLDGVSVYCVERTCRPVSEGLRNDILRRGFNVRRCPLPPLDTCREDTSKFCDWMVTNVGAAPWVTVSHFDVVFQGDYFGYVRSMHESADMIGNHHDGVVSVRREAYERCQVGFCGIDRMCVIRAGADVRVVPLDAPETSQEWRLICLDVGELLALRMHTLGLRHVWLSIGSDLGKSDLFSHARQGSGHGR